MSITVVPNLKEIETRESYFNMSWLKYICNMQKEEKHEEIWTIFNNKYLKNVKAISFNFDMWSNEYVRQKIYS